MDYDTNMYDLLNLLKFCRALDLNINNNKLLEALYVELVKYPSLTFYSFPFSDRVFRLV